MHIVQSKAITFLFVVVVMGFLAACSAGNEQATAPTEQLPWSKSGNTYTYNAEYEVPDNIVEDTFTVTLDDENVVTEVGAVMPAEIGRHEESVQEFVDELRPKIVGRSLSEIEEFDTISGSSLTTAAFNEGLMELKQQVLPNS